MKYIYRHIKKFQLKFSAMEVYDNWSSPIRLIYYAVSSFTRYMRFYFLCHLFENCSSSILIGNEHANDTFRRKHLKSQLGGEIVQASGSPYRIPYRTVDRKKNLYKFFQLEHFRFVRFVLSFHVFNVFEKVARRSVVPGWKHN